MQITLHESLDTRQCATLTHNRKLGDCLIANHTLEELISSDLQQVGFQVIENDQSTEHTVHLPLDHWISVGALYMLSQSFEPTRLMDVRGDLVAWKGALSPEDCEQTIVTEATCFRIRYPWDFLQLNDEVQAVMNTSEIQGYMSPLVQIEGFLHLGEGSRILPGVYIEGNVIIGRNCIIGPNAYIRGNSFIGDDCEIGNGVEIESSIIYPNSVVKNLSYIGDSILGSHVHIGSGTIISNERHDGTNHTSVVNGKSIDTGRSHLGAIIGDGARIGVNTTIHPGRKIGQGPMALN